jgi:uncharacterized caspase-like protein
MNARSRILLALLVLAAAMPARAQETRGGAGPAPIRNKVALVIGNMGYVNALPLQNTGNDANDTCAAFKKLGFEVICKIDVATKRDFKDAIFEFTGKVGHDTVAAFYYAGHGMQVDGVNYLMPTKAALRTRSDIEDENVQINYLMSELEARQAALNIFILDACRNNPFTSPIRGYVPTLGLASQLYAPRNSIIAMSTGAGQLSLDGDGRNGTFTKNLLQNIGTPRLSIEDMFKSVSIGTRADAKRLARVQDPQITTSYAEKFCLAGCADDGAERKRLEATIETNARQAALAQREREIDALNAEIKASGTRMAEQQAEVERMRKALVLQQAGIEARDREIRLRSAAPPENKKKEQPILVPVPAF